MKLTKLILVTLLIIPFITCAQEEGSEDKNLVPNGSFDEVEKKVKEGGMIELSTGWSSPTEVKADLYSKEAKNEDFSIPENKRGREVEEDNGFYAGINLYGYRGKPARSYLKTMLKEPLKEGKDYCVKFHVSLSDLSKYAVNNVGLALLKKEPTKGDVNNYRVNPQITHSRNKIMNEQYTWESICRTYTAKGGEQYLIIGNFERNDSTATEKMKRPRGVTGTQTSDAYYFVENVSIIPSSENPDCACEKDLITAAKMQVVTRKNTSSESVIIPEEKKETVTVPFALMATTLKPDGIKVLIEVAKKLKADPKAKVEIIGHSDEQEEKIAKGEKDISSMRAKSVYTYLFTKGVKKEQMLRKGVKATVPKTNEKTKEARALNRRVEVVFQ